MTDGLILALYAYFFFVIMEYPVAFRLACAGFRVAGRSGVEVALDGFDLGVQRVGYARAQVSLEHEADPGRPRGDRVHGLLDHGHRLVPVALDRGEHRVGPVGQAAGADHADGFRDDLTDVFPYAERGDREGDEHESRLTEQLVHVVRADADLLVVLAAQLDVVEDVERAVRLAVLV